jgi:DNA-directed RNA polymerase subunit RPC12/RpoP
MFRCNQCHTEYGGIRGVSADRCPRCVAKDVTRPGPTAMAETPAASWRPLQLAVSGRSLSAR